jgi:hypothetical protein
LHAIIFPPERDQLVQFITPAGAAALAAGRLRQRLDARLDAGRGRHGLDDIAQAASLAGVLVAPGTGAGGRAPAEQSKLASAVV